MRIIMAIAGYMLVMVIVYTVLMTLSRKTGFAKKPYAEEAILWAAVLWGIWGELATVCLFGFVIWKMMLFFAHQTDAKNENGYL